MSDIAISTLKKFEAFFKTLGMMLSPRPFAIVAVLAAVALGSMRTAQGGHGPSTPHVHVSDHRTSPTTENIVFLVADVDLAYKFSEIPQGSTARGACDGGDWPVLWGARAVSLEPETRYHAALDVHGERGPIQEVHTYDLAMFAYSDTCTFPHRFTSLALGKWEFSVSDQFFRATCLVDLKREDGKVLVKFTRGISVCAPGLSFPSAATVAPVTRGQIINPLQPTLQ